MRSAVVLLLACLVSGWIVAVLAPVAAQAQCLSRQQQREAVRSGEVVRPGEAGRRLGEMLKVQLCHGPAGLEWHITVLGRDGRVKQHVIPAGAGRR